MKKKKTKAKSKSKPKTAQKAAMKKVIVKKIVGHKPTDAYLAALRAVAAMGKPEKK